MRLKRESKGSLAMRFVNGILGVGVAMAASGAGAWGQTTAGATKPATTVQTFYLTNVTQLTATGNEIATAVRNILTPEAKVYFVPHQNALLLSATPDQLVLAQKDCCTTWTEQRKTYRLGVHDHGAGRAEAGRERSTFAMVVVSG